jgi:hypothetical protein
LVYRPRLIKGLVLVLNFVILGYLVRRLYRTRRSAPSVLPTAGPDLP